MSGSALLHANPPHGPGRAARACPVGWWPCAALRTRCGWLGLPITAALAALLWCWHPSSMAADTPGGERPERPNLLVIMTDEHNFRTLGCYRRLLPPDQAYMWGKAVVETPHLDWLAERGALCTSFYAVTPVCSPSRAAFVSGLYPHHTDVVSNNIPLRDGIVTFAEILRRQGYVTGYAGKWHLDGPGKPQWAPARKFGFSDNRFMFNRGHWKKLVLTPRGPRVGARRNGKPTYALDGADEKTYTTDFLTDRAIEFLRAHAHEPFCYMLSIPDPHGPDTVRPPYDTMFAGMTFRPPRSAIAPVKELPSWGKRESKNFHQSRYYGMVKCIDDNVGRILAVLRELKLLERTIVVFTSDHGDLRGEHGRQNKGVPYEASARVPFLLYDAHQVRPGTVVHEALTSVDFLPTVCDLMGVSVPHPVHGRNAATLFRTGRAPADWIDVAFLRSTETQPGWLAAVTDRYKLVFSANDPPWLFDLQTDPDELINHRDRPEYRPVLRRLARHLLDYAQRFDDPFVRHPGIAHDLQWAVSDTSGYEPRAKRAPAES